MKTALVVWLLVLGALASPEPEVISLDLADPDLGESNSTIPTRNPLLGDSIVSRGRFTLTLGTQDLGEGGDSITQQEIDAALEAAKSKKNPKLPSARRIGMMQEALAVQVKEMCEKAEAAPVRTEDLEGLKVKAWGAKQPEQVNKIATEKGFDTEQTAELEKKLEDEYATVREEFESAQREQAELEGKCRSSKENLDEMAAAAERVRTTEVADLKLGSASFNFTKQELKALPVCEKLLGVRGFQKWLSSTHIKDVEMQRRETSCLANRVSEAEYHVGLLEKMLAGAKNTGHLLKMSMRCIISPLSERLFTSIAGTEPDGSQEDIQDFVAAIEQTNRTRLGEVMDLPEVSLSATHATKGSESVPLNKATKEKLPPATKYECLYEEYRKETGAWATGKAAIEQNAGVELKRVESMARGDDEPVPIVRLGSSMDEEGRCSDFLSQFFNSTSSSDAIQEINKKLSKPASGSEDAEEAEEKAKTAATLKRKLDKFVANMKDVINTESAKYADQLGSDLTAAKTTLSNKKVKLRNAQSELDGLREARGTEDKLMSGGCVDSACYIGTKIGTEAIAPFASAEPEGYEEMTWVCRRNAESEGHTRNAFMCSSEQDNKGSVACTGKEAKIGPQWIPFARQITCPDENCEDIKQCSSNQLQISSTNEEKLLRATCMTL